MLSIQKILHATDFSHGSAWAGAYARAFARATGAELHVLYADVLHADAPGSADVPRGEAAAARLQTEMEHARERARGLPDVPVRQVVRRNVSPGPAILDYAQEEDVDLIVMGTHGRRGIRRLVLGSVAEEVLRMANCPVMTVRAQGEALPTSAPRIGPVIAPIDFSDSSKNALRYAVELARPFDAQLHLLHVVEETLHPAFYGLQVQSIYDVHPDIEERAERQLTTLLDAVAGPSPDAVTKALPGRAPVEIVKYAHGQPGSLIVMGTHGLTGFDHFLMGSTTERVVRRAEVPVFSVKSFGKSLVSADPHRAQTAAPTRGEPQ